MPLDNKNNLLALPQLKQAHEIFFASRSAGTHDQDTVFEAISTLKSWASLEMVSDRVKFYSRGPETERMLVAGLGFSALLGYATLQQLIEKCETLELCIPNLQWPSLFQLTNEHVLYCSRMPSWEVLQVPLEWSSSTLHHLKVYDIPFAVNKDLLRTSKALHKSSGEPGYHIPGRIEPDNPYNLCREVETTEEGWIVLTSGTSTDNLDEYLEDPSNTFPLWYRS